MARPKRYPKKINNSSSRYKRRTLKPHFRLFLPWPAVFFVFLVIGVLLAGWTFQAGAADLVLKGRVPAPPLLSPAVITNISDNDRFSETPIYITGTCPLNSYVSIYTNDFYRGSVVCSITGEFEIESDIFPGQNLLSARAYNITDDEGPRSADLVVFYDQSAAGTGDTTTEPPAINPTPFLITANHRYSGATVGQVVGLTLQVRGGSSPYAISIDWGDGARSLISRDEAGEFVAEHIYKKEGSGPGNSYTIKITGVDRRATSSFLQLFVIINPSSLGGIVANTIPTRPSFIDKYSTAAWMTYGIVSLMAVSFYLGEREELSILSRRRRISR